MYYPEMSRIEFVEAALQKLGFRRHGEDRWGNVTFKKDQQTLVANANEEESTVTLSFRATLHARAQNTALHPPSDVDTFYARALTWLSDTCRAT